MVFFNAVCGVVCARESNRKSVLERNKGRLSLTSLYGASLVSDPALTLRFTGSYRAYNVTSKEVYFLVTRCLSASSSGMHNVLTKLDVSASVFNNSLQKE